AGVTRVAAAHPSQRVALGCHGGGGNVIVAAGVGGGPGVVFLPGDPRGGGAPPASQRVALVCHGGVVNVIVAAVVGVGPAMLFLPGYTSVSRVLVASTGERSLASLNELAHLRVAGVAESQLGAGAA